MGTAIIDLNDSAIQCRHGDVAIIAPGYALMTRQGVITGEEALRKAWLLPQQCHNQYWHQLNLSPLNTVSSYARHHADLAYAQLQALYGAANKPAQIIFAMPGNTTTDQLSILLGLVKASPFNAVGLIDAAVAATSQANVSGHILHLDIQLHTSVITRLECGDQTTRHHASQYPDIALKGFYDTWAHFIADRFIREYRFDPLHTAAGEQQLRDLLPGWLNQLKSAAEIEIELTAKQGNFRLNILRSELIAANHQRWQRLADAASRDQGIDLVLLSHRIGNLPGAEQYFEHSQTLPADAAIAACTAHAEDIISDGDKLAFITALPTLTNTTASVPNAASTVTKAAETLSDSADTTNKNTATKQADSIDNTPAEPTAELSGRPPSHVLYGHRAYAIGAALNITVAHDQLHITGSNTSSNTGTTSTPLDTPPQGDTQLSLELSANRLRLCHDIRNAPITVAGDPNDLRVGDSINLNGEILKLIEVI